MTGKERRPLRVLHLRDSPWVDGPGRTILETAAHIDRNRIDYHIGALVADTASSHPLVDAARERRLSIHAIVDPGRSLRPVVDRVVALIDTLSIDILHTSELRSSLVGLRCRRRRSVRLVRTAHGWIANDFRGIARAFVDRLLLRRVDRVILVTSAMRQRLPGWWVPDSRVRVLHNALVLGNYSQDAYRAHRSAPRPGGAVTILNVGRLSPEKGQAMLLRALADLAGEYQHLRLAIAGIGPLEKDLRQLAMDLGVADRVTFLGYVTDMPDLYASTDIVVQSSVTEGLPNVVLEASYLGVPIIATDVGGTYEVIEHGVTGWLIPARSKDALVASLRGFFQHPDRFIAMGCNARARIEERFSFQQRTIAQTAIYEEMMGVGE